MEIRIIIIFLFSFILITGCVNDPQDIPSGMTTDPVFKVDGLVGNQALNFKAGIDNWTAIPGISFIDSNLVYTSIFSVDGCVTNCSPSLQFNFYRDIPFTNGGISDFEQTIKPGPIEIIQPSYESDSFNITLSTHPGLFMSGFSYWADSNTQGTGFMPQFESLLGNQEHLNVCFHSLAYTGCNYEQCISFDPSTLVPCIARIEAGIESYSHVRLTVHPEGTAPFRFLWTNGDTTQNTLMPLQGNVYEIFAGVKVIDGNGNYAQLNQTIRIQNNIVDACFFPISLISEQVNNLSPFINAGKIEIIYTDTNSVVWKSGNGIQPIASSVGIQNIEYYGLSPAQQQAYTIELKATVTLFNTSGDSMVLVLDEATIPLSY